MVIKLVHFVLHLRLQRCLLGESLLRVSDVHGELVITSSCVLQWVRFVFFAVRTGLLNIVQTSGTCFNFIQLIRIIMLNLQGTVRIVPVHFCRDALCGNSQT
jgi:hypothetical protein